MPDPQNSIHGILSKIDRELRTFVLTPSLGRPGSCRLTPTALVRGPRAGFCFDDLCDGQKATVDYTLLPDGSWSVFNLTVTRE